MSAKKRGRPTENPKTERITVRLDESSAKIMHRYCEAQKVDKAEAVRAGLKKLIAEIEE